MKISIDPVACEGLGMCAHQAPDLIALDPWGYPILEAGDVSSEQAASARRAIKACPRRALYETA